MANNWIQKLQKNGMRITAQREAIVEILLQSEKALEPIEVYDLTRQKHPSLGMVTVYRTMECLEELGLLRKVHQDSGCNKYLKVKEGHHHLMVCRKCGKAIYFKGLDMEAQFENIAHQYDFDLEEHWLQLNGLCQQCKISNN
jgi:Fe2+ or Zn2+ uptake regulation protein